MGEYFDPKSTALLATSFEIEGDPSQVTEEQLL